MCRVGREGRDGGPGLPIASREAGRLLVLATVLSILVAGCSSETPAQPEVTRESPIVPVDTGTVRISSGDDTFTLSVEIAESFEQQSFGLMERVHLPEDEGMIFVYGAMHEGSFYMYRTRIPLDIAFFDSDGAIVEILTMQPCTQQFASLCQRYSPGAPYIGALEVNAGYFASRGIGPGDRVVLVRHGNDGEEYWPRQP